MAGLPRPFESLRQLLPIASLSLVATHASDAVGWTGPASPVGSSDTYEGSTAESTVGGDEASATGPTGSSDSPSSLTSVTSSASGGATNIEPAPSDAQRTAPTTQQPPQTGDESNALIAPPASSSSTTNTSAPATSASPSASDDEAGCACRIGDRPKPPPLLLAVGFGFAVLAWGRRRKFT